MVGMLIWIQQLQASQKRARSLQSYTMGGFAKDGLSCVCVVARAVIEAFFAFPVQSLIGHQIRPGTGLWTAQIQTDKQLGELSLPSCIHRTQKPIVDHV